MQQQTMPENLKYSVLESIVKPIWTVSNHWGYFWSLGIFFAIVLTALSYIFGQTFICLFNPSMAQQMFCDTESALYVPYLVAKLIVLAVFITIWNGKVYQNQQISKKYVLSAWRSYLRNFILLCGFIVLNLLPALSGMLLLVRVPNPVWQIELAYFTVVSTGFLAPFILMHFYAAIAEVMNGEWPLSLKQIWHNTSGKGLKIIFSAAMMFMLNIVLLMSVNSTFQSQSTIPAPWYNLIAEIIFNLVTLLITVFMIGFIQTQKNIILNSSES